MPELSVILAGFQDAMTLTNLFYVAVGVLVGQIVGAIPGIGPVMTMAIAIPFTFVLSPVAAISCLIGINKGGLVGGAIPAILINTPGTPDAVATTFDGYPLAKQGKPIKATKMALYSSITGDTFSDLVLITVSVPLAVLALKMGPVEVFSLMVFSFSILTGFVGSSIARGAIAMLLGVLFGTVGLEPENGTNRLIFEQYELYEGIPLISAAIGMLAMPEILRRMAGIKNVTAATVEFDPNQPKEDRSISIGEYWRCRFAMWRGAVIGVFFGAIPGVGSSAAALMNYAITKRTGPESKTFGKGNIAGIAASESANSAVMGANLIPMLSLGIPGNVGAALLIGAFMIHGITPGPTLFEEHGQVVYALFGAMIMANVLNLFFGLACMKLWAKVIRAPETIVFATSFVMCIVGVYLSVGSIFGVLLMLGFAMLALLMGAFGYSPFIFIIAFFLQPRLEESFVQTMSITGGNIMEILNHPVAVVFLAMALFAVIAFSKTRNVKDLLQDENTTF